MSLSTHTCLRKEQKTRTEKDKKKEIRVMDRTNADLLPKSINQSVHQVLCPPICQGRVNGHNGNSLYQEFGLSVESILSCVIGVKSGFWGAFRIKHHLHPKA